MRQKMFRLVLCAVLALVALPAFGTLDGSISGIARDDSGQPIPGVTVTVSGPVLQGSRTAVTRSDGSYHLPNLPPGTGYGLRFELEGLKSVEVRDVQVSLGGDTQVGATLGVTEISEMITVTAESPLIDATKTATGQNFDKEYLRKMTVLPPTRNYQAVLQQSPGVTGTGNPNVNGGNLLENSWNVDGINATDAVTHTFSLNLNFDSIQEMSVQTANFSAEYGRASGGFINVVTKSGGNDFSGTFDVRYQDEGFRENGDHSRPGDVPSSTFPIAATLGGPVLRDRLWFFLGTQRRDEETTPLNVNPVVAAQNPNPSPGEFKGWNSSAKLSYTLNPKISGFLSLQDSRADIPIANVLARPEATRTQKQESQILSLRLDALPVSDLILSLIGGYHKSSLESGPSSGNLATSGWTNTLSGSVVYDNHTNFQSSDRDRLVGGLVATYFLSGFGGNHTIKGGLELDKTEFPSVNYATGTPSSPSLCPGTLTCGATFQFRGFDAAGNRVPFRQFVSQRLPELNREGRAYSYYLQDEWRPTNRMIFNLGARYDRNDYINNEGKKVIDFAKFQPRLGASFDVLGDGSTMIKGSYGYFYVDAALTLNRLFDTGYTSAYSRQYDWSTTLNSWQFVRQTGGVPLTAVLVDQPLEPTYDEQYNLTFERALWQGAAVALTYLHKETKNIYEDTCTDQVDCPEFWVSNRPGRDLGVDNALRKDYEALQLELNYRFARGSVNSSYVYSKSKGSIDSSGGQYAGTDFDFYPWNFVNRYGYLDDDARNRFKLFGYYRIPKIETIVSLSYFYRSGLPWTPAKADPFGGLEFVERRGNRRTPSLSQLDLTIEKPFNIRAGKGFQLSVLASVYNVLNQEAATTIFARVDAPSTFGTPSAYQAPRAYQVGLRFEF